MLPAIEEIPETKRKLLDAATGLMLRAGFTATSVDSICAEAGVTKGSFFHYFKSKEEIGVAAIEYFGARQSAAFAGADFVRIEDPLDRLDGMLEFMAEAVRSGGGPPACLIGNLAQEMAPTHEVFREACGCRFGDFTSNVAATLAEAKERHDPVVDFDPERVSWLCLSLVQGSMVVSKAKGTAEVTLSNIEMFRDYICRLFGRERKA